MGLRKKLFGWCPRPVNPISMTLRRYSAPLAILVTATVLLVSFILLSSGSLFRAPPSAPELPTVTSTPTPIQTPSITASPTPSPSPPPTLALWPASNQPPPDRSSQALATSSTFDPAGDTLSPSGAAVNASSSIDIVYAEIKQIDSSTLRFSATMAGTIPPPYSQGYTWRLDTDMNSSTGTQNPKYDDLGVDDFIAVGVFHPYYDGGEHRPIAWLTQNPLSDGRDQPKIPWSQITVSGNTITVTISLYDIGNPTSISWVIYANDASTDYSDKAPNSGHMTLTIS